MRRVVSVIPGPTFGGAANVLARLRAPLLERGFDVVGVLPDEPGNAAPRARELGADVRRLPMHRARATGDVAHHAAWLMSLPAELRALRRLMRDLDADVVQAHGDLNPHGGLAGHLERAAVAWQLLDTRSPARLRPLTMRWVLRCADVVMTWGHDLGRQYPGVTALGDRHIAVYPPVDTAALAPDASARAAARAELHVPEGAVVVGSIANRNPQKAQDALIRAVATARRRHPELVVRIIGAPSPGHDAYERSLHDAARACGLRAPVEIAFVDPGGRVPQLIHALDVLAISSPPRSEGVPTVLFEAMACGIPCVTTDVGAVREVIDSGRDGLIVPALDEPALAAALADLAGDAALRDRLGAAGRRRLLAEHGLGPCADRYAEAYERALRHRAARRRAAAAAPAAAA